LGGYKRWEDNRTVSVGLAKRKEHMKRGKFFVQRFGLNDFVQGMLRKGGVSGTNASKGKRNFDGIKVPRTGKGYIRASSVTIARRK